MPRDFDHRAPEEEGTAPYPADRPGWCDAILCDAPAAPPAPRRPGHALPESGDLLGWSMLVLTAPALLACALILASQAALHLL